ncbi:hypothetical protein LguiB_004080 [Lonicera macranthoides]
MEKLNKYAYLRWKGIFILLILGIYSIGDGLSSIKICLFKMERHIHFVNT